MPSLVGKVRVGRNAVDFNAKLFEFGIVVCQVSQLGWANKSEVSRIEKNDRPFATQVSIGNIDEFAIVERGCVERKDFGIDE